jgi:hypothetical protein
MMDDAMPSHPVRLERRDRFALGYRVVAASAGLGLGAWAFASGAIDHLAVIAFFVVLIVGGAAVYHLVTSIVRCPTCAATVRNFRIQDDDAPRKTFRCARCGTAAYLTEGFFWQSDVSG